MSQIDYFKRQVAEFRKALEGDITEQDKRGLRIAIIEYEKCIAYLQRDAEHINARTNAGELTLHSAPPLSNLRLLRP